MVAGFLDFSNKHAVVETTLLLATHWGEHITHIRMAKDHDNGVIVGIGDFVEPDYFEEGTSTGFEGQILHIQGNGRYVIRVTKAEDGDLLVASEPIPYHNYTREMSDEAQYYNKKGELARCYQLRYGDRFALSKEGFTTEPTEADIGKTVTVDTTTKKLVIG